MLIWVRDGPLVHVTMVFRRIDVYGSSERCAGFHQTVNLIATFNRKREGDFTRSS
jgi:hypothetical protein